MKQDGWQAVCSWSYEIRICSLKPLALFQIKIKINLCSIVVLNKMLLNKTPSGKGQGKKKHIIPSQGAVDCIESTDNGEKGGPLIFNIDLFLHDMRKK